MSKKSSNFKIDPNKKYEFRLDRPHGGIYVVTGNTRAWDIETERIRTIRLCRNDDTPYEDEQREDAVVDGTGITFKEGKAIIDGKEAYKINFLLAHDGNKDKGSKISPTSRHMSFRWELVNKDEEFKSELRLRKLKHELESKVLSASKEDLLEFLVSIYNYKPVTNSIDELITEVLKKVQVTPQLVKDKFATKETKLKSKIIGLFKSGELVNTKGLVTWKDGGLEVNEFKISEELKLVDSMIEWISKGSKAAVAFEKRLAAL